jgi:hypothetical protein
VSNPARVDLDRANGLAIYRGDNPYRVSFQFFDDLDVPIDFTGCTGKAQIRDRNGLLLADFVVSFRPLGWCDFVLSGTEALNPINTARFDLFVTYSNSDRLCEVEGKVEIADRVTVP